MTGVKPDTTWGVPGYRPVRELGTGASGRVVHAIHDATGQPVAIKYLSEQLRYSPGFLESFRLEARILAALRSDFIVHLHSYVEEDCGAAIVMELVTGVSLRAVLREHGRTTPEAALLVLKGSLLGLAAAHSLGVIHRDYKPENVLVSVHGTSKLADFGIAARTNESAQATGTPAYMSPEQWRGAPARASTDVYAATATFFECLTGSKPFTGETLAELAIQHASSLVPHEGVPAALRPLISWGMAKAPSCRPQDASLFIAELDKVASSAYGADWEERGKRTLAAVLALSPLLIPAAGPVAGGNTDLVTTTLPATDAVVKQELPAVQPELPAVQFATARRGSKSPRHLSSHVNRIPKWAAYSAGALVIVGGTTATIAAAGGSSRDQSAVEHPESAGQLTSDPSNSQDLPASTATPGSSASASQAQHPSPAETDQVEAPENAPGPGSGESAGSGPEGAPPPDEGPSGTTDSTPTVGGQTASPPASTSSSGGGQSPAPTDDAPGGGQPPASTPPPSPTTSPPVTVSFLGLTSLSPIGNASARATMLVTTSSISPITVTVRWFDATTSSDAANPGSPDGAPTTLKLSGKTSYQISAEHIFDGRQCSRRWAALLTSTPAPEVVRPYRSIPSTAC
ncbi:protein kinase [Streptomyces sp. TX20-6-3]|uniref:protein kinase domain-containing protein n=1 Tax=Streptomyces sp. TX20-6-3 TaxID=3028705 RepID=UPI0029B9F872|nr:protein kinase [Streptomyces sp. TX20-6-3]MDX2565379.1 protein kinase [Streptomyces sp. TX20-6-3]